jgi:hypothetical protein
VRCELLRCHLCGAVGFRQFLACGGGGRLILRGMRSPEGNSFELLSSLPRVRVHGNPITEQQESTSAPVSPETST